MVLTTAAFLIVVEVAQRTDMERREHDAGTIAAMLQGVIVACFMLHDLAFEAEVLLGQLPRRLVDCS